MCVCLCVCLCVCFMGDNTLYWLTGELPPLQRKLKNNKKQQKQKQRKPVLKVLLEDPGERKSPYFRDNWQEDIKNWGSGNSLTQYIMKQLFFLRRVNEFATLIV